MSSQLKVNSISDAAGANGNAITLATDGTCTAKVTNNLSNRNLIINGAMNVAQRGASSTSGGYTVIDRWQLNDNNTNVTITQAQHALTSSDTGPWAKGFRNSYHASLSAAGNSLSGASYVRLKYIIESQDIASSGWDYTSASSDITLSFWFKASTNQTFHAKVHSGDSDKVYPFSFTASGNDTWTKITKTIPGNANVTFNNDTGYGLGLYISLHHGSNYTGSITLNEWSTLNASVQYPTDASTWLTAGTSSFEITGVQLEVGDHATDFEHRSFGDELFACQRYYCQSSNYGTTPADGSSSSTALLVNAAANHTLTETIPFLREMRAAPTVTAYEESSAGGGSSGQWAWYIEGSWNYFSMTPTHIRTRHFAAAYNSYTGGSDGDTYMGHINWKAEAEL